MWNRWEGKNRIELFFTNWNLMRPSITRVDDFSELSFTNWRFLGYVHETMTHINDSSQEISHDPQLPIKLGNKLVLVIIRQANWAQVCAKRTFNYVSNTHISRHKLWCHELWRHNLRDLQNWVYYPRYRDIKIKYISLIQFQAL